MQLRFLHSQRQLRAMEVEMERLKLQLLEEQDLLLILGRLAKDLPTLLV